MAAAARNLLILISDEHRRDALGCMGHRWVKTPHLDALAARGTIFTNAYTPSPICVPARAAIATGEPVHRTGHWDSATPYDGRPESWMHRVRATGAEVVSIGKLHFRGRGEDCGFAREILPMHVVGGQGWTVGLLREDPPPYDAAAELAADVGVGSSSYTDYDLAVTEAAEAWLADPARADRPWAAFVSMVSPHYPLTAPEAWFRLYDPAALDLPVPGGGVVTDHPELRALRGFFDYDRYFDEAKTREALAAYYALTSFMDDCMGRVLAALEASGQAGETLVVYVSDHGDMMGDQGFWTKSVMFEASAGVPMIVAGPGVPEGRSLSTGASLLDLAPTAEGVFGAEPGPGPGASLMGLAAGGEDRDRTVFSEHHDGGSSTGAFMIRWGAWKYVHYAGMAPQLFDLEADPAELTDLAPRAPEDPRIVAALAEGRRRLFAICDPEAVNARAFADQRRLIEALGGREACQAVAFNHTPAPVAEGGGREGTAL